MTERTQQSPLAEQRRQHIVDLGFKPVGTTDFFQVRERGGFVLDIDPATGKYNFLVDYNNSIQPQQVRALDVSSSRHTESSTLQVLQYDVHRGEMSTLEYTLNGSGGGIMDESVEAHLQQLSALPVAEQLQQSGFKEDKDTPGIWKRMFKDDEGDREVIAVVQNGTLLRLLQPIAPQLLTRYKIDEDTEIVAIGEGIDVVGRPVDVLTLQNNLVRLDLSSRDNQGWVENVQLVREVLPEELGIEPYPQHPDTSTPTFVVGGANSTEVISTLKRLNGRTIAKLEAIMRPYGTGGMESSICVGFIGRDESLVDILTADNEYVHSLGLIHQDMALPIKYVGKIANLGLGKEFTFRGSRYQIEVHTTRGIQFSPFGDQTGSGTDVVIHNLTNGQSLACGLLLGDMIDRWGFYEGKETEYRLDPQDILRVFPYLQELSAQQLGER